MTRQMRYIYIGDDDDDDDDNDDNDDDESAPLKYRDSPLNGRWNFPKKETVLYNNQSLETNF